VSDKQLFRQAVVEHRAKGKEAGKVFAFRDRLASRVLALLVVLVLGSVAASCVVTVEESTRGAATAAGDESVLLLPVGAIGRLHAGLPVRITTGGRTVRARLSAVDGPVRRDGTTYAVARVPVAVSGSAVVVLGRASLAAVLVPGLAR